MKRTFLLIIISTLGLSSIYSQQFKPDSTVIQEINDQLWKPFQKTYAAMDWEGFNALHTDDVIRINTWSGIQTGAEYKKSNEISFQKPTDVKRTIDFRFEQRIHRDKEAYEIGYYKLTYTHPEKGVRNYYAQFHVRLTKQEGTWKISQDFDIDVINGRKITAVDFEKENLTDLN